jgi:hypothetical protein
MVVWALLAGALAGGIVAFVGIGLAAPLLLVPLAAVVGAVVVGLGDRIAATFAEDAA